MRIVLLLVIALLSLVGCSDAVDGPDEKRGDTSDAVFRFPPARTWTVDDDQPPLDFDRAKPFVLELGRGSGMDGLETTKIDESRTVTVHRREYPDWQSTSFALTKNELDAVLDLLETHRLLDLKREYHAEIYDGTQWVFCLKQGAGRKSIYCNNSFPDEITKFATALDAELNLPVRELQWTKVPEAEAGAHDAGCWDCTRDQGNP